MNFVPRFYQTDALDSVYPLKGRKLIVIPTGGGKSYIAGRLSTDATLLVGRVLILTHVKELVEQNARAILQADPLADIGIVCAGLDPAELPPELRGFYGRTDAEITIASVQSVYRKLPLWDNVGLIIIDEAHRITPIGGKLYRAVLNHFPDVPLIGLTATPFRMGTGYLTEGEHRLFDEICYEISHHELVELGYLVPFATRGSALAYEDEGLKTIGGEFSQASLNELAKDAEKTQKIVKQLVQRARDRNHWLIFAMNVRHARVIRDLLAADGIEAGIIYDGMEKEGLDRDLEISLFKLGIYRALINVNVLTTGFDFPALDCVILLRPIASIVLYIQCLGRGTRICIETGKVDCLILDYGGNVSRHGDFSKPNVREKKPGKKAKECEPCGERNTTGARFCAACGSKFKEMFKPCPKCKVELDRSAQQCHACRYEYPINEVSLDENGVTIINEKAIWVDIATWKAKVNKPFCKFNEEQRPDCVMIDYKGVDGVTFKEYLFPESYAARRNFDRFWIAHSKMWDKGQGSTTLPQTSKQAVENWNELRLPRRVKVIRSGKYYNVLAREYGSD